LSHNWWRIGSQDLARENLTEYEKAFTLIKEATGIDDINELVHQFKQVEDQSFSLFNYVNEVNDELEKMRKEIVEINKGMDTLKEESVKMDEERKRKTKELEVLLPARYILSSQVLLIELHRAN
jgi:uncharacterized coiled-coil DUF342 family protein